MQDTNLTNPKPNPNLNLLTLTRTLVRSLIRKIITHTNCHFLLPKIYNNFCYSASDLYCPANSQNWQIVQEGHAYNQCDNNNPTNMHARTHITHSTHPSSNGFTFWNLHRQSKVRYSNMTWEQHQQTHWFLTKMLTRTDNISIELIN